MKTLHSIPVELRGPAIPEEAKKLIVYLAKGGAYTKFIVTPNYVKISDGESWLTLNYTDGYWGSVYDRVFLSSEDLNTLWEAVKNIAEITYENIT